MANHGLFGFGSGMNVNPVGAAAGIFGLANPGKNPADEANKIVGQIPGQTSGYFDPYSQAGQRQIKPMEEEYQKLIGNPGQKLNDIGSNYQQSPGFQFALQQALQGSGHAAAAGGMAGSPQHEQENMGIASGLASQDYNNWLGQATGLYNTGLQGGENSMNRGLNAGDQQANMIAQTLAQQGAYSYNGQAAQNKARSDALGQIGSAFSFGN
jgi:hypothetical protein